MKVKIRDYLQDTDFPDMAPVTKKTRRENTEKFNGRGSYNSKEKAKYLNSFRRVP